MKRLILLPFLLIFAFTLCAQTSKKTVKDTLVWKNDSMLVVSDFEGKSKGKAYFGFASTGIILYFKEKDGVMLLVVEAIFQKSKSYMRGDSSYMLKHEQLHFDIAELYARKLRQRISQKKFAKKNNLNNEIMKMFNKENAELNKIQDEYDIDTEHSQNSAKQKLWNKKISSQLKMLEGFANTEIEFAM